MSNLENMYIKHIISGNTYAVQYDYDTMRMISACGPLHHVEVTQANIRNYNFTNKPELIQDLELQHQAHAFRTLVLRETCILCNSNSGPEYTDKAGHNFHVCGWCYGHFFQENNHVLPDDITPYVEKAHEFFKRAKGEDNETNDKRHSSGG